MAALAERICAAAGRTGFRSAGQVFVEHVLSPNGVIIKQTRVGVPDARLIKRVVSFDEIRLSHRDPLEFHEREMERLLLGPVEQAALEAI